jgi:hypothetical protein
MSIQACVLLLQISGVLILLNYHFVGMPDKSGRWRMRCMVESRVGKKQFKQDEDLRFSQQDKEKISPGSGAFSVPASS